MTSEDAQIIAEALTRALPEIGKQIVNVLGLTVPVDTGALKASIVFSVGSNGIEITMLNYGKFVEFGTRNSRPNPFIRSSLHRFLPRIIVNAIKEEL